MSNVAFRSFAGGEIAPQMYARTDLAKFQTALRKLLNFIIHRHGGLSNRPGTRFIAEAKDSSRTIRLIPFVFNDAQTYVLEFGLGYIRFYRQGVQLEVLLGGAPYEIGSPYEEEHLMDLRFVQSADVITIVHPLYKPRNLTRLGDINWTLEVIPFGASIGSVTNLLATGGAVSSLDTLYAVTAIDATTGEEGLPALFTLALAKPGAGADTVSLSWDPLTGASGYRVYRSLDGGSTYALMQDAGGGTPFPVTDTTWVTDDSFVEDFTGDGLWHAAGGQARNQVIAAGSPGKPFNHTFTIRGILTLSSDNSSNAGGRLQAYYKRDAEARVFAGTIANADVLGAGPGIGGGYSEVFIGSITVPDNGYANLTIDIVPEVTGDSFAPGDGVRCEADFSSGLTPYKQIDWNTITTGFTDIGADGDPLQSPPRDRQLFNAAGKFPTCVGIYQQRKLYGDTLEEPETVYGSRTGAYNNFFISRPLEDDDAVTWSNAGRKVNAVQHLLDLGKLLVFTSGGVTRVDGGADGILMPTAISPTKLSASGIGSLPPLEVIDAALYVQSRGNIVRDIQPLETNDGFSTKDVSLYAAHLFHNFTIVDWAYAESPDSIVWAVRDDGILLGLTYLPEQAIFGWHRHRTDGFVERVVSVPEGDRDAVYMVVKRTIDGADVRYIERLEARESTVLADAFFVDCGITLTGAGDLEGTISGLDHLEGKQVAVLADGIVIANPNRGTGLTVTGGAIELPVNDALPASTLQIGLPYLSDIETLDIDTPQGSSRKDTKMLMSRVSLFLAETQGGIHVGQSEPAGIDPLEDLTELELDSSALVTDSVDLQGIVATWNNNGRMFVRQVDPVPVTILAVIPQGYL